MLITNVVTKNARQTGQHLSNQEFATRGNDGAMISVWCEWNGWHTAMVRVTDLENVHWFQPHHAIHAQVRSSKLLFGETPQHQNVDSHYVPVCVLRYEVHPSVFEELSRRLANVQCQ